MNHICPDPSDPRIAAALDELRELIRARYPDAVFDVRIGDDPTGVYLRAQVDIDDVDEVMDVVIDRIYDIEVERGLPVYVVPVWPPERVAAELRRREQQRAASLD